MFGCIWKDRIGACFPTTDRPNSFIYGYTLFKHKPVFF